ncbi:unnamed protein product [Cuscuta europaea]|uniref:SLH domain-containing protein n=1 Tax=Cuscuta europaea TaxID=41803 RepID=A0A9P1ELW1_CUSEU|nr:unnamed protein product [Cuscuta europaea]
MCSSVSPISLYLPSGSRFPYLPNLKHPPLPFLIRTRCIRFPISASPVKKNVGLSWEESSDLYASHAYNGWTVEKPVFKEINKGWPTFVKISTWASVAAFLGAAAYFSMHMKGYSQFTRPSNSMHGYSVPNTRDGQVTDEPLEDYQSFEACRENVPAALGQNAVADPKNMTTQGEPQRIIIPFSADSTQKDALVVLKKLEIVEDEVKAEELCTRRECARWLVRQSMLLEREMKHKIDSSIALAGSTVAAFNDIDIEDPDFFVIQSLAESGIIPSKLSLEKFPSAPYDSIGHNGVNFFPDRYVSRQDLISWKAKLEYDIIPEIDEEMSRRKIGFLDVRDISSQVLVDLFVDIQANERSIARNVFGQGNRFQPNKPCTKGQVAVALTSGKMREYALFKLRHLEDERSSRLANMEELKQDLLDSGDIKHFWQSKMEEEKCRGQEVNATYLVAIDDLDRAKVDLENAQAELVKQKAALDCQKQLLLSLKEEVEEMSGTLASEKAVYLEEKRNLQNMLCDLQVKYKGILDTKSVLEAEVEASRILRSLVANEAVKNQARANVLEEAVRRWRWEKS